MITYFARAIYNEHYNRRSEQDVISILGYLNRLKCFDKYNTATKKKLAAKVNYNCFHKQDVLFEQGKLARLFYIVLSGRVQEYDTKKTSGRTRFLCIHIICRVCLFLSCSS